MFAWAALQPFPHEPQLNASLVVKASHPFDRLLSQFAHPGWHVMPQVPEEHDDVPLVELHALVQVPQ